MYELFYGNWQRDEINLIFRQLFDRAHGLGDLWGKLFLCHPFERLDICAIWHWKKLSRVNDEKWANFIFTRKKTLSSLELDLMAVRCLISNFFSCVVWSRARAPCCWVWGKINMETSVAIHHWTSSFSSSAYVGVSEMETEKQALRGDEWPYCQHHINIMWQTSLCSTAMSIIIIAVCWHFETSASAAKWAQKYLPTLARDR